ncbi:unnamed protein product, partial [Ectocarpus fasciculatus]
MWSTLLVLGASVGWADPLNEAITAFNTMSHYDIPALTGEQRAQLRQGGVVKFIDGGGDGLTTPKRSIAYVLTAAPRDDLWVSYLDVHFTQESTRYHLVQSQPPDRMTWYGYLDLPWPFDDRHWVTTSWNNHEISQATGGRMWEHPWQLEPDWRALVEPLVDGGQIPWMGRDVLDASIYLPKNSGAFVTIGLDDDQILMVYHSTSAIGGSVPEDAMLRYLLRTIDELVTQVDERARKVVPGHYTAGH